MGITLLDEKEDAPRPNTFKKQWAHSDLVSTIYSICSNGCEFSVWKILNIYMYTHISMYVFWNYCSYFALWDFAMKMQEGRNPKAKMGIYFSFVSVIKSFLWLFLFSKMPEVRLSSSLALDTDIEMQLMVSVLAKPSLECVHPILECLGTNSSFQS